MMLVLLLVLSTGKKILHMRPYISSSIAILNILIIAGVFVLVLAHGDWVTLRMVLITGSCLSALSEK